MIITGTITAQVEVTKDVICNNCGDSCNKGFDEEHVDVYGAEVRYSTGYLSEALPDGKTYQFHLCEGCLAIMMAKFKVPATEHDFF